jgi:hypothetical protein
VFSDVSGVVLDPIQNPIAGASVQAYDRGGPAGAAVISDAKGAFDVTGPFSTGVTIHATKDGYRPGVASEVGGPPSGSGWTAVLLVPDVPTAQIAPGVYTLTITAGAGCDAVPADLQTVVYPAKVNPPDDDAPTVTNVKVWNDFPPSDANGFGIGIAGQQAAFTIDDLALVRELPGATYLSFWGTGTATIANSPATSVAFDVEGVYDYCVLTSPMPRDRWTTCNILPADQIVKHTTCQVGGFVLSATQAQGVAARRKR